MTKLKLFDSDIPWELSEKLWDAGAEIAATQKPLKKLKTLPNIPGITTETKRFLKWKSFKYLLFHKEGKTIINYILKHPFKYTTRYFLSLFRKKSYIRKQDLFFYGIRSIEEFKKKCSAPNALVVFGFSYCQKPHECPEGRFTKGCISDPAHPVCRQCDIGKVIHALPEKAIPIIIPTVHDIGIELFARTQQNPHKKIVFVITACEMTLEMFGDFGNMIDVKGIGVRLDGRICNTMQAFKLSEEGIKPGLTVVTSHTQKQILDLVRFLKSLP